MELIKLHWPAGTQRRLGTKCYHMSDYTVRLVENLKGWHWRIAEGNEILAHGQASTLWDAVNHAYRAMKAELNKGAGNQW